MPDDSRLRLVIRNLTFRYGERVALQDVSFTVEPAEIFGLLGPNGGGKTTLFRLLTTLLPLQSGQIELGPHSLSDNAAAIRALLGVTFQSPSLDGKLTVQENLWHQGHLYGLLGGNLSRRIDEVTSWLGVQDRLTQLVDTLSGGLKRRVEIAKSLLHKPRCLILDEPSTGLDPGARLDLWTVLARLREQEQMTILVTTHLMDEAERCDRVAILDRGHLVASGSPTELRAELGGETLILKTADAAQLATAIANRFGVEPQTVGNDLRIERPQALELLRDLVSAFPQEILAISLAKPTLEDVFISKTGHHFWE
ncbi:ATP-binding cassette domain-containing protein [bacterium]|nr:ATP-binding cassette domain-containing protein [bacterium]